MNGILDAIEKRSSTRSYTAQKLTRDQIAALIKAGLQAPTARNEQEIHFTVAESTNPIVKEIEDEKNSLNCLAESEVNFYYDAPTLIFLSADKDFPWSAVDAGIAVENISLAAEQLGLGSVIIGCIKAALRGEKKDYFAKALAFPENCEFEIAIAVGYKAGEKVPHEFDEGENVTYL